jgi:hypothetical protein
MRDRSTRTYLKAWSGLPAAMLFMALLLITGPGTAAADDLPAVGHREVSGQVAVSTGHGLVSLMARQTGTPQAESAGTAQKPKSWVARHPVIVGTLIGTGAGFALSRVDAIGGANHDPRVALIGAGAGAWGGLVASAVQKVRAKEKVGLGRKIGIAAGAVGLIALPVLACYGAGGCGGVS